jgi:arylsulfatase A-like enzyme
MNYHVLLAILVAGVGSLASTTMRAGEAKPSQPNIVVILADDFGWGSSTCYGAEGVLTPNLDRLAREGRRFTNAYAPGSVCSPSRYGLMTGRYYWRTNIKDGEVLRVDAPLHIETNRLTLASLCKSRGYKTAGFGKWHLGLQSDGPATDWSRPLSPGPLAVGFDTFFGLAANPNNGPHAFIEDDRIVGRVPGEPVAITPAGTTGIARQFEPDQIMQTLTAKATGWIETHRTEPFFLYFAPNAVHGPIVPSPGFAGSHAGSYGDFIHELDWSVGQLLATLDRLALADDTLIVFTSDNGGIVDRKSEHVVRALDAGLAINGPLRGGKHSEYEGGFREPFLVRWPGHVPAGTVSDQVIGLTDMVATCAEILGVSLPPAAAEDSYSVLRAFTEAATGPPVRDHVILQAASAVYSLRQGDWKLVERVGAPAYERRPTKHAVKHDPNASAHDELFNLREDPAEQHDVAADNAALVASMKQRLSAARDQGFTRPGASVPRSTATRRQPNVLVIVADDLGYGELGCQGFTQDIPTPNIDSIAASGVRFTSGYVSCPYCSPTRAGLLTGRYQQRFGHEFNPGPAALTPPTVGLPVTEATIGDRLRAAGYATGWIGKSHQGYAPQFHPLKRGFDEFFGFLGGKHDFLSAAGDSTDPIVRGTAPIAEIDYTTDAFGREAADFIERHKDGPWLCYLAFNAVHAPLQATEKYLARFPGIEDPKRQTFAAMLSAMDDAVGVTLDALRRSGLEDDTLVVFLSDNGGPTASITSGNGPLRGFKSQTWEGGIRVPFVMQWKGRFPEGVVDDRPVIQLDILPTALAAAGVPLSDKGTLDGVNLLPFLTGGDAGDPHESLFWRFGPQIALRRGDWKLVKAPDGGGVLRGSRDGLATTVDAQLYNLRHDMGEQENLAERHPEKLRELAMAWETIDSGMIEPLWRDGPKERGSEVKPAAVPAASQP